MTKTTEYPNDRQILDAIYQHIALRLEHLVRLTYHHECNIPEPTMAEQTEYGEALGEQRALQTVSRIIMELQP